MSNSAESDPAGREAQARRLAALSPAKRALLERELKKRQAAGPDGAAAPERTRIGHRPRRDSAPLSFAQQRLWFLDQLEPAQRRLQRAEDVSHSRTARPHGARTGAERHCSPPRSAADDVRVRTGAGGQPLSTPTTAPASAPESTPPATGDPEQRIHPPPPSTCSSTSPRPAGSLREGDAQQQLREAIRRPFDLATDLMLRATLIELEEADHILLLLTHHIASDGWSMGVLTRELGMLYEAILSGQPATLPEFDIQYADYAWWQRQPGQLALIESQLAYWKAQLAGAAMLELPTDRPRVRSRDYASASVEIAWPAALCHDVRQLGRQNGATLYMTLLAAVQLLLARYTGQDEVAVGSPIAGRAESEVEGLIGFFINTLVLRTDLSGNPSFRELLRRTTRVAARCLHASGRPLRARRRRAAAGAQPWSQPVRGRRVRVPEHAGRGTAHSRLHGDRDRARQRHLEVRPHADAGGAGRRHSRAPRLLCRSVRPRDSRASGRAPRDAAAQRGRAAGRADIGVGVADRRRKCTRCWWTGTRRHARLPARRYHPRAVRGAGTAVTRQRGRGLRRGTALVPRAEPTRQPGGARPARHRTSATARSSASRWSARRN